MAMRSLSAHSPNEISRSFEETRRNAFLTSPPTKETMTMSRTRHPIHLGWTLDAARLISHANIPIAFPMSSLASFSRKSTTDSGDNDGGGEDDDGGSDSSLGLGLWLPLLDVCTTLGTVLLRRWIAEMMFLSSSSPLQLQPRHSALAAGMTKSSSLSSSSSSAVVGLPNRGQLCFANSIVQALAPLQNWLEHLEVLVCSRSSHHNENAEDDNSNDNDDNNDNEMALCVLALLASVGATSPRYEYALRKRKWFNKTTSVCPLVSRVANTYPQFRGLTQQQDAHEFFQALMDVIGVNDDYVNHKMEEVEGSEVCGKESTEVANGKESMEPSGCQKLPHPPLHRSNSMFHQDEEKKCDEIASPSTSPSPSVSHYREEEVKSIGNESNEITNLKGEAGHLQKKTTIMDNDVQLMCIMNGMQSSTSDCSSHPCLSKQLNSTNPNIKAGCENKEAFEDCVSTETSSLPRNVLSESPHPRTTAPTKKRRSMSNPFVGRMGSKVQCSVCHTIRYQPHVPFTTISLVPSVQGSIFSSLTSIEVLLKQYFRAETVKDVECQDCGRRSCDMHFGVGTTDLCPAVTTDVEKTHWIVNLPQVLCLHLQRRQCLNCRYVKWDGRVEFSEWLDSSSFSSQHNNTQQRQSYRLMSVVEHIGGANSGHYHTYRRTEDFSGGTKNKSSRWTRVSDQQVVPVDWEVVRNCQAYMLFYEASSSVFSFMQSFSLGF